MVLSLGHSIRVESTWIVFVASPQNLWMTLDMLPTAKISLWSYAWDVNILIIGVNMPLPPLHLALYSKVKMVDKSKNSKQS